MSGTLISLSLSVRPRNASAIRRRNRSRNCWNASSKPPPNPGDIVFDPFCGCGTALDAAHGLGRRWVGIDLTVLALEPMERRLRERHGLVPKVDYHH